MYLLSDLISVNDTSSIVRTRACFDPCLLHDRRLAKFVLIRFLSDHLCMLLQHCGMPLI